MIRGAIEMVRRTQISGWIFAEAGTINDQTVLAFSGDRCVGAGKIDRFRQDLLEAQLGDGHCGFEFPINLNEDETPGSVIVRLQNSDVALIQAHTKLIGPGEQAGTGADLGAIAPGLLPWMQDRGWLEQHEFDFLRSVQTIGAFERGLRPIRRPNTDLPTPLKPEQVVRDLLSLFMLSEVDVMRSTAASISELAGPASPLHTEGVAVVALWCNQRCRIALDERSHVRPGAAPGAITVAGVEGSIEYVFGPDRVLFLHRNASFAPHGVAPADGIVVFTARCREAAVVTLRRRDQAA